MKYLKVWTSFRDIIQPLDDDEKGRLFMAMLNYAESGAEPDDFPGNERFIWPVARRDIDLAAEWNEVCRKNGSKGGRPKKPNPDEASETHENPLKPNETQINPKKPNDNLKVKEIKVKEIKEKKTEIRRFTPPTLTEVTDYCRERQNGIDAQRFIDFYASNGWKVGNQPMKDWKACIRTWEQRDRKPVSGGYVQRDYSGKQDEATKRMLAMLEDDAV